MEEVIELEIWSRPGKNLDYEAGSDLALTISNELDLDNDIVLGLTFVPDKSHVDNLLYAINEGELLANNFSSFCKEHNLDLSINDFRSAACYLEYEYGRVLSWLHVPDNNKAAPLIEKIKVWCKSHGYNVQEGDDLYCFL